MDTAVAAGLRGPGPRSCATRRRRGTATASSASSSTGASTPCRPSATSGTRATCTSRAPRSSRTTWRSSGRSRGSATRTSSRVQGRAFSAGDWARLFKERREVRGAGGRAPRRLPDVRLQPHRVVGREDGAEARRRGRALARGAGRRARIRPLLPPRRALVVLRRRQRVRLRREGPALRRLLRPGAPAEEGRGQSEPPTKEYLDDWLARTGRAGRQVPPAARLVRLWIERRPSRRTCSASRPSTTTGRGVAEGRRDQLQERVLPREGGRARRRARPAAGIRPEFWQTDTSISKNSWGYSRSRTTRRPARSSTTWSTSSARTAPCAQHRSRRPIRQDPLAAR